MRKFKPYLEIIINYEGGQDSNLDYRLTEYAWKFDGEQGGSGFSFVNGMRDISFEFSTIKNAVAFVKAAKRFKRVISVTSRSVLTRDDG